MKRIGDPSVLTAPLRPLTLRRKHRFRAGSGMLDDQSETRGDLGKSGLVINARFAADDPEHSRPNEEWDPKPSVNPPSAKATTKKATR